MDYEANFAEVKQAKKVKPQVTRSCIYVTTLSMSIMWSAEWVDRKKVGFSGLKRFTKKSLFIQIENFFRQGSLHEM